MQSKIIVNYLEFLHVGAVQRSIVVATKCSGCNEAVSVGQMAIFTEKLGCESCWHPQCFRCCTDGDLLIDLLYFVFNQKLYCARHWSEQIKPRCHACEEVGWVSTVIQFFKEMFLLKALLATAGYPLALHWTKAYSKPCQASKMGRFANTVND